MKYPYKVEFAGTIVETEGPHRAAFEAWKQMQLSCKEHYVWTFDVYFNGEGATGRNRKVHLTRDDLERMQKVEGEECSSKKRRR